LSNTSEIPMTFNLRIGAEESWRQQDRPEEKQDLRSVSGSVLSDFVVLPQSGTLPPNYQQPIEVGSTGHLLETYGQRAHRAAR